VIYAQRQSLLQPYSDALRLIAKYLFMKTIVLIFLLSAVSTGICAAKPQVYYWVIETNTCKNNLSIIRIYDDKHQLIYTEHVEKVLDIADPKVSRRLNRKAKKLTALKEQ
jgi:hypothetical protein